MDGPDEQFRQEHWCAHEQTHASRSNTVCSEQSELPKLQPVRCDLSVSSKALLTVTANHDSPNAKHVTGQSLWDSCNLTVSVSTLFLPGKVEGHSVKFLLDSGCTLNLLSCAVFEKLPESLKRSISAYKVPGKLADGSALPFHGQLELSVRLRSEQARITMVVADIEFDAILGMPFFHDHACEIMFGDATLVMNGKPLRCTNQYGIDFTSKIQVVSSVTIPACSEKLIKCRLCKPVHSRLGVVESAGVSTKHGITLAASINTCDEGRRLMVRCLNPSDQACVVPSGAVVGCFTSIENDQVIEQDFTQGVMDVSTNQVRQNVPTGVDTVPQHVESLYQEAVVTCSEPLQRQAIANVLTNYSDVFSSGEHDVGRTNLTKHSIPVLPETKPIRHAPRRLGVEKEAEVERQVQQLKHQGLIEPAFGAWSSAVVLVKKKDGCWRFCVDYRRLNAVTQQDAYPLPRIDESLDALSGSTYFSTLDLMSGYWQVPLDEDAKDKSAFCTRSGLWRWNVLPFGLTSAPATFQRLMERVLQGLHWKTLLLYLDDVIVIGANFESHLHRLQEVLDRLRSAGLKLKPSKCHLFQTEVRYLGHVVSNRGVSTDPEKVEAVADWVPPRKQSELHSFLGTVGYYRQYIEGFATIAKPLTHLTAKNVRFQWTDECQKAFDSLKQSLISAPVLGYPDASCEYILDTDASLVGVGAVLSQIQHGQERVISYYSKTLQPVQRNYCVTRRELLAVVKAVTHFKPYLYGRKFTVRTDHASLIWLCRRSEPSHQIARWLEILSEFKFTIIHRAGIKHGNADGLSRRPCTDCKQCARILSRDGGPSMDEILNEHENGKNSTEHVMVDRGQLHEVPNHDVSGDCTPEKHGCISSENANSSQGCCDVNAELEKVRVSHGNQEQANPIELARPRQLHDTPIPTIQPICATQQSQSSSDSGSDELSQAQQQPSDLAVIYDAVLNHQELDQAMISVGSSELKKLNTMISLMRIREDGVLVVRVLIATRPREVIICPKPMRKEIMWETHNLAHAGIMRSLRRLRLIWYWPGITSDVRRLVNSCEICQQAKYGGLHRASIHGPLFAGRPWQKLAVDLVGPMPVTPRNNKWILVLTDHFTRWQDALPLPDATAAVIAGVLEKRVFCYFGLPEEIHSDRGSQFEGDLMAELCSLWRITKTRTTAYHPQSNGVVERNNRTMGDALRSMLLNFDGVQEDWDDLLPQLMRAFRATPHSKTGETANFLMLGRECRLPDQLVHGTHSIQLVTRTRYATELKERLELAHELLRSQQLRSMRTPNNEEDTLFSPGELVLVERKRRRRGVNPKLQPKFEGPFMVKKAFGNGTYKIQGRGTVNECRLKLLHRCPDVEGQPNQPAVPAEDEPGRELERELDLSPSADGVQEDPPIEISQYVPYPLACSHDYEPANPNGRPRRNRREPLHLQDYVRY